VGKNLGKKEEGEKERESMGRSRRVSWGATGRNTWSETTPTSIINQSHAVFARFKEKKLEGVP